MTESRYVSTATAGNRITNYHLRESCPCLAGSTYREIDAEAIQRRQLDRCGQCERLFRDAGHDTDSESEPQDWSAYQALREAAETRAND